jgi:hypothetical protein
MLHEREIPEEWLWRTVRNPDKCEEIRQGTTHYIRAIPEQGGRFLRVVVNTRVRPNQVVTLFFDRRLGRHR